MEEHISTISAAGWRRRLRSVSTIVPPARWPLLLGAALALPLAFWPWISVGFCAHILCTPGTVWTTETINPLRVALDIYLGSHRPDAWAYHFFNVIIVAFVGFGLIAAVWVHGVIRSYGQYIGAVLLTLWTVAFAVGGFGSIRWLFGSPIFLIGSITGWSLTMGGDMFIVVLCLLGVGLVLLWRDVWRSRSTLEMGPLFVIERLAPWGYVSAAIATLGSIVWFCGYYGIYWLLAPQCPPTPLFGSAQCERISGEGGYNQFFSNSTNTLPIDFTYWIIGMLLVFGGAAMLYILWTQHPTRFQGLVYWLWLGDICLLALVSFIGVRAIEADRGRVVVSNGPAVTLLGIALLAASGLVRVATTRISKQATENERMV